VKQFPRVGDGCHGKWTPWLKGCFKCVRLSVKCAVAGHVAALNEE
jgi:hypothetical protein